MMDSKDRLLVEIARMYYENNMNQKEIADRFNISRTYVSKLLEKAKSRGIVQITIRDPEGAEGPLEKRLRKEFGLAAVHVVSATGDSPEADMYSVARAAARYIDGIVRNDTVIAYSWGHTIYACSREMTRRGDIHGITAVQMCGGVSNLDRKIYASEIATNIAEAYNGTPYILPLPAVLQSASTKKAVLKDASMTRIMDMAKRAEIALFTVGTFGMDSAIYRAGYLTDEEIEGLTRKGAVGDVCAHFIDSAGEVCDPLIDSRTISIGLEDMLACPHRICAVLGRNKLLALLGALRKRYINVLVTDDVMARNLLNYISEREA
ncbi:MAG TPA: sugar-binding transcriptional regulator [Clostridia bacterium]